jgi:hypothetical protein
MIRSASISMRTPGAIHFGTADHIALTMLMVDSPGEMEQGQELEFQLELPGLEETVYGSAEVHHAEHYEDRPSRYELRIQHLRAGDEVLLREWVEDLRAGGSSIHPHRLVRESDINSAISEARTANLEGLPSGAVSTWDARRAAASGPSRRGRGSLRDGLRRHIERAEDPEVALQNGEIEIEPTQHPDAVDIEIEITEP